MGGGKSFAADSGMGFAGAACRRFKNQAHLAKSSVKFVGEEALFGYYVWSENRLKVHLRNRASNASDSIRQASRTVSEFVGQFAQAGVVKMTHSKPPAHHDSL